MNDDQYRREQQYQQNMVRYHAELNAWHQLSDEQKARRSNRQRTIAVASGVLSLLALSVICCTNQCDQAWLATHFG